MPIKFKDERELQKEQEIANLLRGVADYVEKGRVDYYIQNGSGFKPEFAPGNPTHNYYTENGKFVLDLNVEFPCTKTEFYEMTESKNSVQKTLEEVINIIEEVQDESNFTQSSKSMLCKNICDRIIHKVKDLNI